MRILFFLLSVLLAGPAAAQVARCTDSSGVSVPYSGSVDHPCVIDHSTGEIWVKTSGTTPSAAATYGIAPVVTATAASSKVLKNSAGNLYGFTTTIGASAGYVLVFDATAAPADGTVTPVDCVSVPAASTVGVVYNPPLVMAAGATITFSTGASCFTQTLSATAFISGEAK